MKHTPIAKSARQVALGTALLLLVPLVAMQFTGEVAWGPVDFLAAGALLFGAGMAFSLAARQLQTRRQRVAVALVIAAGLAIVWAELSVGLFR